MVMQRIIYTFLLFCLTTAQGLSASVVDALCNIKARAQQSQTDALLVVRNGKQVFEYHTSREFPRLDVGEMTRPILALAFGFLCDERYITCLDAPVSVFCPSWDCGSAANTTIRSLLSEESEAFYRLGEVVEAISGQEWHDYIQTKLFNPLGISRACWSVCPSGQVKLRMTAPELAKIGMLIACNGEHQGKQLLSRRWIAVLQSPTGHLDPFSAMQWFLEYYDFSTYWDENLLCLYFSKGVSGAVIATLRPLNGRVVHFGGLSIRGHLIHGWGRDIFCALGGQRGLTALLAEAHSHRVPLGYFNGGSVKSLVAWGIGGQQLIINPSRRIVAVRQTAHLGCRDVFEDFIEALDGYIAEVDCYID